ncbi:RNA-directed DNA polymerase, eukaryota, reverse transcriptase zinc-binding domain protein [Tanacetum coccineum]
MNQLHCRKEVDFELRAFKDTSTINLGAESFSIIDVYSLQFVLIIYKLDHCCSMRESALALASHSGGRGLRQGDPMTPYLFTLIIEMLSLIVQDKVERGSDFQYHFGCKQIKITHVCFADDLLMFCHGDKGSVSTIKDDIEEFGEISGLFLNYSKSTIIFGSMSMDEQQEILDCVPFKVEKLPVKYLGVPLSSKRLSVNNCKCLIDKIKNKVFKWKNKCLSYAGRLQLIASVLESIHGELSKGKAKVAWLNICRPKSMGGLGLKEMEVWNKCMIMKHLWNIASAKNTLWVKWVSTVKLKGRSIWAINEDASDSWGWKNILKIREEARKFMNFITSRDIYNARRNENIVVKDILVDGICQWPIEWIVKYPILAMHQSIHLESDKEDYLVWKTRMGSEKIFSVSQAYYDLNNSDEDVKWNKLVWFS